MATKKEKHIATDGPSVLDKINTGAPYWEVRVEDRVYIFIGYIPATEFAERHRRFDPGCAIKLTQKFK